MDNVNGGAGPPQPSAQNLERFQQALEVAYSPKSSNDIRRDAAEWLDGEKKRPYAPQAGFILASDRNLSPQARLFGLTLLEYSIRFRWGDLGEKSSQFFRAWITELPSNLDDQDPAYIRNKFANVWAILAQTIWPEEWDDLDTQLLQLWQISFAHQMMTINILEGLSESIQLKKDDSILDKDGIFGRACIEIFTPAAHFLELFPNQQQGSAMRADESGWLVKLIERLSECCDSIADEKSAKSCASQILNTLSSIISWMPLKLFALVNCQETLGRCLQVADPEIQLAALDVLLTLSRRSDFHKDDLSRLIAPLMTQDALVLFHNIYESTTVSIDDMDDQKYLIRKKLSELVSALATFITKDIQPLLQHIDLHRTFDLLEYLFLDPSLVVSLPALYTWKLLLRVTHPAVAEACSRKYNMLLDTSRARSLKYGSLPEDSSNIHLQFLLIDFDMVTDRQAFVANYKSYCQRILESIVATNPSDALENILTQTGGYLQSLSSETPTSHEMDTYADSETSLRVEAECSVVNSTFKAYRLFMPRLSLSQAKIDPSRVRMREMTEQWCTGLLTKWFTDPAIERSVLNMVGDVILQMDSLDDGFLLDAFYHALDKIFRDAVPENPYGEGIKEANFACTRFLRRIVMQHADVFFKSYAGIEEAIQYVSSEFALDGRVKNDLRAVLFYAIHRASVPPPEERISRLQGFMNEVIAPWQDPSFTKAAGSFESFCEFFRFQDLLEYFRSRNVSTESDWADVKLDAQGSELRENITKQLEALPLHYTRAILTAATDKVISGSNQFRTSVQLWDEPIILILPTLVPFLSHANAFSDPNHWPDALQPFVQKILVERVWQSGISSVNKEEFHRRIRESKESLEGLASAIRALVRGIREMSYWILHCFAQFGDPFYRHHDLAEPLSRALYEYSTSLSVSQVTTLCHISQTLVDSCPANQLEAFMPPLLTTLFTQLDHKLTTEWNRLNESEQTGLEDSSLDAEMKAGSMLSQLTQSSAAMACAILRPDTQGYKAETRIRLREVVFSDATALSSIVTFCAHVIRMRCVSCKHVADMFRFLLPEMDRPQDIGMPDHVVTELREFLCSDLLRAVLNSFHEPYFAGLDMAQSTFAALIAAIIYHLQRFTQTPREVLLSLSGMSRSEVDQALNKIRTTKNQKDRNGVVIKLLKKLQGVSIHEMGRIVAKTGHQRQKKAQPQYSMKMDEDKTRIERGGSPEPGALSNLFG